MMQATEAVNAKTVYIHDASDGDSPLPGVKFQLMTDTQHPMIHNVSFDLNKNIRLISFEEADGRIYVLLLMWDQTASTRISVCFPLKRQTVGYMSYC